MRSPYWLLLLPCGSVLFALAWLRRRWLAHEAAVVDQAIAVNRQQLAARLDGQTLDESKRASAERRRAAVDDKKRQAAQIASGQPVEERIRLVK